MLLPMSSASTTVREAIEFTYDNVYGEAFEGEDARPREFRQRCLSLKERVEQFVSACTFGRYPIPREIARLLLWAEDKGLGADL